MDRKSWSRGLPDPDNIRANLRLPRRWPRGLGFVDPCSFNFSDPLVEDFQVFSDKDFIGTSAGEKLTKYIHSLTFLVYLALREYIFPGEFF